MPSSLQPGVGCCTCRIRPCRAGKHLLGDSARCGQEAKELQPWDTAVTMWVSVARTGKRAWRRAGACGGLRHRACTPIRLQCTLRQWVTSPWVGSGGGFGVLGGAGWPQQAGGCVGGVKPGSCQLEPARHPRVPLAAALPLGRGAAAPAAPGEPRRGGWWWHRGFHALWGDAAGLGWEGSAGGCAPLADDGILAGGVCCWCPATTSWRGCPVLLNVPSLSPQGCVWGPAADCPHLCRSPG